MMLRLLVLSLFFTTTAFAEPVISKVTQSGKQLGLIVTQTRVVPEQRTITVNVNGKNELRTVTVNVPVAMSILVPLDEKAGDYFDMDGKAIDPKNLKDHVKADVVVALIEDGKAPDADARKTLVEKKVQLIVVAKQAKKDPDPIPIPKTAPVVPKDGPPVKDKAPAFFVAKATLVGETLQVSRMITVYEQIQVTEKRKGPNGVEVDVVVTKMVPVIKQQLSSYYAASFTYQTPDGKPLKREDALKLLKEDAKLIIIAPVEAPPTEEQLKETKEAKDVVLVALLAPRAKKAEPERVAPKPMPEAEQPSVAEVRLVDGKLELTVPKMVLVKLPVFNAVKQPDGSFKEEQAFVPVQRLQTQKLTLDLAAAEYQTLDGKKFDVKELPKLLETNRYAIFSPTGKAIPEAFLKANSTAGFVILPRK